MARVPLLLALLCSLAADSRQEPPRSRAGLYQAVVWHFLSRAHGSGGPGGTAGEVGEAERQTVLAALARAAFTFATRPGGRVDQMPYHELAGALRAADSTLGDPGVLVDHLGRQAGLLVPAGSPAEGEQDYLFLHRTIAEYLLARHLAEARSEDRMREVTAHQWFDPDWAEVIPMLATLLAARNPPEAQALVTHFLTARPDPFHHAFGTALRIIGDAPDPDRLLSGAASRELLRALPRLLRSTHTRGRLERILTAAPAWPQPISATVLALAASRRPSERHFAATILQGQRDAEATHTLITLATDTIALVRQAAARALEGRQDSKVTAALITLATETNTNAHVRRTAAEALKGREGSEVTAALIALATDADILVRRAAADTLAQRRELDFLEWTCRRWRVGEPLGLVRERRDLAEQVAGSLYVLVPAQKRPRTLRRLGNLPSRSAEPASPASMQQSEHPGHPIAHLSTRAESFPHASN